MANDLLAPLEAKDVGYMYSGATSTNALEGLSLKVADREFV